LLDGSLDGSLDGLPLGWTSDWRRSEGFLVPLSGEPRGEEGEEAEEAEEEVVMEGKERGRWKRR
jgi:hypothetical protein